MSMREPTRSIDRKLSVGCGHEARAGWTNLDISALPGVDVVHDLDDIPLPFPDASFDYIECVDILEHVRELPAVMGELHRVLAPGGRMWIEGPHFTSSTWPMDPTHRRAFSINTFEFFVGGAGHDRDYYFDYSFARVDVRRIAFQKAALMPWNYLAEWVVNRHRKIQSFYESTFLARLLPAHKIQVQLVR